MVAQNYAIVNSSGKVENVIVIDPDTTDVNEFASSLGSNLVPLDDWLGGGWGIGWLFHETAAGPVHPNPNISADPSTIPANETTASTVTVTWPDHPLVTPPDGDIPITVNGEESEVTHDGSLTLEFEVVASVPGTVTVEVAGTSIVIKATGV
ncbi:MAG: hypothetical protein WD061_03225 [Candidatus Saccharimonadales bacterium]